MYVDTGCGATIINTTIQNNTANHQNAGAGIYMKGVSLTITDSIVSGNDTSNNASTCGGGIRIDAGSVTITGSEISSNSVMGGAGGGGICMTGTSTLTLSESYVQGNEVVNTNDNSDGGGIKIASGTATITNSIISGNVTGYGFNSEGGGLYVNGTANIYHSTVAGNWGKRGGGIYVSASGTASINGALLWDNQATDAGYDILVNASGTATVDYTAIKSGSGYTAGTGIVTAVTGTVFVDPQQATPGVFNVSAGTPNSTGDYHIKSDAVEIIDSADPSSTVTIDIDGGDRTSSVNNDMGADEYGVP